MDVVRSNIDCLLYSRMIKCQRKRKESSNEALNCIPIIIIDASQTRNAVYYHGEVMSIAMVLFQCYIALVHVRSLHPLRPITLTPPWKGEWINKLSSLRVNQSFLIATSRRCVYVVVCFDAPRRASLNDITFPKHQRLETDAAKPRLFRVGIKLLCICANFVFPLLSTTV